MAGWEAAARVGVPAPLVDGTLGNRPPTRRCHPAGLGCGSARRCVLGGRQRSAPGGRQRTPTVASAALCPAPGSAACRAPGACGGSRPTARRCDRACAAPCPPAAAPASCQTHPRSHQLLQVQHPAGTPWPQLGLQRSMPPELLPPPRNAGTARAPRAARPAAAAHGRTAPPPQGHPAPGPWQMRQVWPAARAAGCPARPGAAPGGKGRTRGGERAPQHGDPRPQLSLRGM